MLSSPLRKIPERIKFFYLAPVIGEHWKDLWMDEVELGLNFVATKIVYRATILIEYQVLSTGSKAGKVSESNNTLCPS